MTACCIDLQAMNAFSTGIGKELHESIVARDKTRCPLTLVFAAAPLERHSQESPIIPTAKSHPLSPPPRVTHYPYRQESPIIPPLSWVVASFKSLVLQILVLHLGALVRHVSVKSSRASSQHQPPAHFQERPCKDHCGNHVHPPHHSHTTSILQITETSIHPSLDASRVPLSLSGPCRPRTCGMPGHISHCRRARYARLDVGDMHV